MMDLAHDSLDERDEPHELAVAGVPSPGELAGAETDAGDEPVLGPLGRRLLTLGVIAGLVLLIVLLIWLLGMLAYTTPPVPGTV